MHPLPPSLSRSSPPAILVSVLAAAALVACVAPRPAATVADRSASEGGGSEGAGSEGSGSGSEGGGSDDTGTGGDDGGSGGGDDTGTPVDSTCPEAPHQPGDTLDDYADYPVFITGGDRRFRTVQDGIWGAEDGDTVVVCPGRYVEDIDFVGKAIRLTSLAGPAQTVLEGTGSAAVVSLRNWEPPEAVLEGLHITGGRGSEDHGGGVFVEWGSPTVRYNVVTDNHTRIGGGIYVRNGAATVHNNVVAFNRADEGGGGIVCTACAGAFHYNTVYENQAGQGSVGEWFWGIGELVGNVLVTDGGGGSYAIIWREPRGETFATDHNLLWPADVGIAGGPAPASEWPSDEGWVRADPRLVDPEGGDWHLASDSPAVDAGPADATDPDGSRADLGAFGGPAGAWPW